jgi:putative endonuclease
VRCLLASPSRTLKQQTGQAAEDRACAYLCQHGLILRDKNFRCKAGEIDLIMQDQQIWVFVEVRARASALFGGAIASVDLKKLNKLQKAAQWYLQLKAGRNQQTWPRCRIDVVAVNAGKLEWVKNVLS